MYCAILIYNIRWNSIFFILMYCSILLNSNCTFLDLNVLPCFNRQRALHCLWCFRFAKQNFWIALLFVETKWYIFPIHYCCVLISIIKIQPPTGILSLNFGLKINSRLKFSFSSNLGLRGCTQLCTHYSSHSMTTISIYQITFADCWRIGFSL